VSQNYDLEVDVIVVGYGSAGSAAAISAHDAGASVILLEKMPHLGGNTGVAGGNMTIPKNPEAFKKHLKTLVFETVEPELIDTFVDGLMQNPDWFKEMGAALRRFAVPPASCSTYIPDVTFPGVPGAEDVAVYCIKESDVATSPCGGQRLMQVMSRQVEKRNIRVMLSTPAKELIQNQNKEIVGILAESEGKEIAIKAKKGVILTCGGFENNPELKRDFLSPKFMHFSGNAGNTGDGLKMVQKVGASLWHLGIHLARCGMKVPGFEATFSPDFVDPGFIWLDKQGNRFTNESYMDVHLFGELLAKFDNDRFEYSNIPFYAIFDEQVRRMGAVCWGVSGPNIIVHGYKWSADNLEEIKKGWIIKADSLPELAEKLSMDSSTLSETMNTYNENCKNGIDPVFNRSKDVLRPLEGPPYYALELWPSVINTQGGPKRDAEARVLDPDNNPIPRLYAAGEFGSIWGFKYQTSTNISEALIYGRIAAKNAANSEPVE
jgi:succinate dehydrogenase/fumarate reductase flavoprotein subunit